MNTIFASLVTGVLTLAPVGFVPAGANTISESYNHYVGKNLKLTHSISEKDKKENAKEIITRARLYGLSDWHIAGMLGYFDVTSNLNPASFEDPADIRFGDKVEGNFGLKITPPYDDIARFGPSVELAYKSSWDSFASYYENKGLKLDKQGYLGSDGKHYLGVGIGSWTGKSAEDFYKYSLNSDKIYAIFDLNTQLDYIFKGANTSISNEYIKRLESYKSKSVNNADEAIRSFVGVYVYGHGEGGHVHNKEVLVTKTSDWFKYIQSLR